MTQYRQKKIAMINDLSGYGRCSLTVALPILSAMRMQCCPVPTSILSNHTGFPVYFFDDYTEKMEAYLEKWKELNLDFDGIATGFLGSGEQIHIVSSMIKSFRGEETRVIVDPIMGDHGKPYATYTPDMCREMEKLVRLADVVTPNVTEACILTGRAYKGEGWSRNELKKMALEIQKMGPGAVVITGVSSREKARMGAAPAGAAAELSTEENGPVYLTNVLLEPDGKLTFQKSAKTGGERPGTGDVFSSIIAGAAVQGWDMKAAVRLAARFVKECIQKSDELKVPVEDGVCFEELLPELVLACRRMGK
ncbi:MAG: pyridoxamine kinase [Lachnospiraceae bacterium]|nr:pyridoxamine kinase [Lachnospiraceae bacterium]